MMKEKWKSPYSARSRIYIFLIITTLDDGWKWWKYIQTNNIVREIIFRYIVEKKKKNFVNKDIISR